MIMNPEGSTECMFQSAFISHVMCLLAESKVSELKRLGFSSQQIRHLEQIKGVGLHELCFGPPVFTFRIDAEAFDMAITNAKDRAVCQQKKLDCIARGAPPAMMAHFFRMTTSEYNRLAKFRDQEIATGRTPAVPADIADAIYDRMSNWDSLESDAILALSEELDIPVRCVWKEIQAFNTAENVA